MPTANFRLHTLSIEGFKAFTEQNGLELLGKHVFIFGENGCGKSSIIEAIRWCLFGLADRPETEVRNAFYPPGECRVELGLQGPGGIWKIVRRLRPGSSRSDFTIANPQGDATPLSQVFPHLARLGLREGTHIIFAAQQETGRRPHADISDFDKVLYSYLRLEDIPELLDRMDKVLEEHEQAEKRVASQISETEEEIRRNLERVTLQLEEILRNKPWKEGEIPTSGETEERIRKFATELASLSGTSAEPHNAAEVLLEQAEKWALQLLTAKRSAIQTSLLKQNEKKAKIEGLWAEKQRVEREKVGAEEEIRRIDSEVFGILKGTRDDQLRQELSEVKQIMAKETANLLITRQGQEYLKYSPSECPVCSSPYTSTELRNRIQEALARLEPKQSQLADRIQALQQVCDQLDTLRRSREIQSSCMEAACNRMEEIVNDLRSLLTSDELELTERERKSALSALEESINALREALGEDEARGRNWKSSIERLRAELRFQRYRGEQERLREQLDQGLEPIRERHRELVDIIDTVREIKEKLQATFNEELDRTFPYLDNMLSEVYGRLTRQLSFERIHVRRDEGSSSARKLSAYVSSRRTPGSLFKAEDVLNGQALSALRLVPYFVFSQFQAESLELDFLLIDDPSQSFDTSRVHLLLQELARAGMHAQLVIATHEADRFEPEIFKHFGPGECKVLKVTGFEPEKGPTLAFKS